MAQQSVARDEAARDDKPMLLRALETAVNEALKSGFENCVTVPIEVRIAVDPIEFKATLDAVDELGRHAEATSAKLVKIIGQCERLAEISAALDKHK